MARVQYLKSNSNSYLQEEATLRQVTCRYHSPRRIDMILHRPPGQQRSSGCHWELKRACAHPIAMVAHFSSSKRVAAGNL